MLATLLCGITGSYYWAEHIAVKLSIDLWGVSLGPAVASLVALVMMTVVVLIFAEATPMQIAVRHRRQVATWSAPVVALLTILLYPVVGLLELIVRGLMYLVGLGGHGMLPTVTEEQLKAMIEEGQSQGALAQSTGRMLHGALDFGDQTAAQVMTPRPDMICIDADATVAEALHTALAAKHSRLPVIAGDKDHVIGILYVKDILPYVRLGELDTPVRTMARPHFVPESLPVDEVLRQLRVGRRTMAIVYDDAAACRAGDRRGPLEEIVGDIQDEYDIETPEIIRTDSGIICDASISLHELDNLVAESLPTEEYDSLGGLVLELAGRIPEVGESFRWGGLTLTVEEMEGLRISRIKITETPEEPSYPDGEQP